MLRKYFLPLSLIVAVLLAGYIGYTLIASSDESDSLESTTTAENSQGCCIDPPCQECFEKLGFCDCEEREEKGIEACEECEAAESCGEQLDACEIDLE